MPVTVWNVTITLLIFSYVLMAWILSQKASIALNLGFPFDVHQTYYFSGAFFEPFVSINSCSISKSRK